MSRRIEEGPLSEPETSDISVVITYYNREQYIDEAVQSVLAQMVMPR